MSTLSRLGVRREPTYGSAMVGARLGLLNVPARLIGALAPLLFAIGLAYSAPLALGVLIAACVLALGCLAALRRPAA